MVNPKSENESQSATQSTDGTLNVLQSATQSANGTLNDLQSAAQGDKSDLNPADRLREMSRENPKATRKYMATELGMVQCCVACLSRKYGIHL